MIVPYKFHKTTYNNYYDIEMVIVCVSRFKEQI